MFAIIEEILSFIADILLLRNQRERGQRPRNSWRKDAADVAYLNLWLATVLSVLAGVGFVLLFYVVGLPFWLSFGLPTLAAGVYLSYRWFALSKG